MLNAGQRVDEFKCEKKCWGGNTPQTDHILLTKCAAQVGGAVLARQPCYPIP
jgi:hypothetical protein